MFFITLNAKAHGPFIEIVPESAITHKVINSGLWSDSNTWENGLIPSSGANVFVPPSLELEYDLSSSDRIKTIRVDGKLSFSDSKDTKLIVDYIAVNHGAIFEIGSASKPIPENIKANIIFAAVDPNKSEIDTSWDPRQISRGLVAGMNSKVNIYGAYKTSYTSLNSNHLAGSSTIDLASMPADWRVGDVIVLTGTEWGNKKNGDNYDDNSLNRDEFLMIDSINGNSLSFHHMLNPSKSTLNYDHKTPDGFDFNIYVANLSRNIVFETEGRETAPVTEWAHTMFMTNDVNIDYAQFIAMGRTNKNKLIDDPKFDSNGKLIAGTGKNPRGRYSIHFHRIFDHDSDVNNTVHVKGAAVCMSMGWGITTHHSASVIEDSIVFDAVGAGFVTEDGTEQAIHRRNIAIKMRGSNDVKNANLIHPSGPRGKLNDFGSSGSGYWIDTSYSARAFEENIAVSTDDAAIIMYGQNDLDQGPVIDINKINPELHSIFANDTEIRAVTIPVINFKNNIVYNSEGMMEIRGVQRDDNGYATGRPNVKHLINSVFEGTKAWALRQFGYSFHYAAHLHVKDSVIAGNGISSFDKARAPDTPRSIGIFSDKNARHIVLENNRVENFRVGATLPQTGHQGYDSENPIGASKLIGGTFKNNINNILPAPGREGRKPSNPYISPGLRKAPFPTYTEIDDTVVFEIPSDNIAPVASFTSRGLGGRSVQFDASSSVDPDYILDWSDTVNNPYTAGDNTVASFTWDFNNDGIADEYGRYAIYHFPSVGDYLVNLTVRDFQGATHTVTKTIAVSELDYTNLVYDPGFDQKYLDTWNMPWSYSVSDGGDLQKWTGSDKWQYDANNKWVYAEKDTHRGTTIAQIIHDQKVHRGLQTVKLYALNQGDNNELRLKIEGVNRCLYRVPVGDINAKLINSAHEDLETTIIFDSNNIASEEFNWKTIKWDNVDFSDGFEFIVIRLMHDDVRMDQGEYLAVDNVFVGTDTSPVNGSNSSPVAINDSAELIQDSFIDIEVLANDFDPDGDALEITNLSGASNGSISINSDKTIRYTPNPAYFGVDTFTYELSDGQSIAIGTVQVRVNQITQNINTQSIRINVGGDEYIDNSGLIWIEDDFYNGGNAVNSAANVNGTSDDTLYATNRYARDLKYSIPVSNGSYKVKLYFAESFFNRAGSRVFDINIESNKLKSDFDILAESGAKLNAIILEFDDISVSDSSLDLDLLASINNAKVSAIEILNLGLIDNPDIPEPPIDTDEEEGIQFTNQLNLSGNTWKKVELDYEVTENTYLEFDFLANGEGEIQGIALDDDNNQGSSSQKLLKLYGTQNFANLAYDNYGTEGEWKSYKIKLGKHFTGLQKHIVFVNDNDNRRSVSESFFKNIKLYEGASSDRLKLQKISFADDKLLSYSDQDRTPTDFSITELEDKLTVQEFRLSGNSWKKLELEYDVNPDTCIEFDFLANGEGEIQGIALDNDNNQNSDSYKLMKLYGTQNYGNLAYDNYDLEGEWQHYKINLGKYFTGLQKHIVFVNDNDSRSSVSESFFKNIKIYDGLGSNKANLLSPVFADQDLSSYSDQDKTPTSYFIHE